MSIVVNLIAFDARVIGLLVVLLGVPSLASRYVDFLDVSRVRRWHGIWSGLLWKFVLHTIVSACFPGYVVHSVSVLFIGVLI